MADEKENIDASLDEPLKNSKSEDNSAIDDTEGQVRQAKFSNISEEKTNAKPVDIDFLMDISLSLSIELGRAVLNFKKLLALKEGSVVELNKLAGDPVDIFVNNKMIARGEVVVIDDNFGVRVTDILNPTELINNLKASPEN